MSKPRDLSCDICSAPNPVWYVDAENFTMPGGMGRSTDGWALCRPCTTAFVAKDEEALFQCAVGQLGASGALAVLEGALDPSFTVLRDLHRRVWAAWAAKGEPPPTMLPERQALVIGTVSAVRSRLERAQAHGDYDAVRQSLIERAGLSAAQLDGVMALPLNLKMGPGGPVPVAAKMTEEERGPWRAWLEAEGDEFTQTIERRMPVDAITALRYDEPSPYAKRPWMEALEAQCAAVGMLDKLRRNMAKHGLRDFKPPYGDLPPATHGSATRVRNELAINWQRDLEVLKVADTYAWYGDARQAVQMAAQSVPHDAALTTDLIPGIGQGFWWFTPPMDVPTTDDHRQVCGLLWSIAVRDVKHAQFGSTVQATHLTFSTYVKDTLNNGGPIPTAMWRWDLGMTFHQMLARMEVEYDRAYGVGAPWEGLAGHGLHAPDGLQSSAFGKAQTMKAVADMSLFFLAGCAWLQQEIVHVVPGHVERHRRKQLAREHGITRPLESVKVIALRKAHYEHAEAVDVTDAPEETSGASSVREYSVRWVVRGHWRNQPCGPARTERKLLFIHPYIKGPDSAPLHQPKRVFAVVR